MNPEKILKISGVVVVALIILYSFLPGEQLSFEDTILNHRGEVHDFMRNDEDSPLPDSLKSDFDAFDYFDPDADFKIVATLETIPGDSKLSMATNDGQVTEYTRYAFAVFEIGAQTFKLTLFQSPDADGSLFLPFGDLTNGETTYGGGRYLDLKRTNRNKITIDFNRAYNPYCAYGADFSCPLPPAENRLSVAINAGEMNFK